MPLKNITIMGTTGHIHPCKCSVDGESGFFCTTPAMECVAQLVPICFSCDPYTQQTYVGVWGNKLTQQTFQRFLKMLSWKKCGGCGLWFRWYSTQGSVVAGVGCSKCGFLEYGPPHSTPPVGTIGKPAKQPKKCGCNPCSGNLS